MAKEKKKKQKIKIFFKDGKTDVIPQKFWDDYEVNVTMKSMTDCSWSKRRAHGLHFTAWTLLLVW